MFADKATIKVRAGKGGDGKTSFRRERFVSKGGPDGGNGGRGGNVIFVADHNLNHLASFRGLKQIKSEDGGNGRASKAAGRSGEDKVVHVPCGTVVLEGDSVLADLNRDGEEAVIARGGRGGYGNAHFKSSTRQAPRHAELGEPGEAKEITLELKMIADVGLVGKPNAGKSTFLSAVSNAKPDIADYPFTTLVPYLGVADIDEQSLLLADIPGLIAGASQGKGLGDEFLRHVERTVLLLHLIDITEEDVVAAYETINKELAEYKIDLSGKPQLVVLTKTDAVDDQQQRAKEKQIKQAVHVPVFSISSVARTGITELLRETARQVTAELEKQSEEPAGEPEVPVLTIADDPEAWWVEQTGPGHWHVQGQKLEGFARRTDTRNQEALARLRDIFKKKGVDRELTRLGVSPGDTIEIAGKKFEW